MIGLLLRIKHGLPWIWNCVERINSAIFNFFWGDIAGKASGVVSAYSPTGLEFSALGEDDIKPLEGFLASLPESSYNYFRPHLFDEASLRKQFSNKSFLMMKATDPASGNIVGYFFLRCFFVGAAFAGLIVDPALQGKGIGTAMWRACMGISNKVKLRLFATISAENQPSLSSCRQATDMRVIKKMSSNYLFVRCKSK